MNILLVSQCNKRALAETCRILDRFAERKGARRWQATITREALTVLYTQLRKTARRDTAVACYRIKSAGQTELLWVAGNLRRFDAGGAVPSDTASSESLRQGDENSWSSGTTICLLAALAALFHDFGKANQLFQLLLRQKVKGGQSWRHEWVSLRLFCAFVAGRSDVEWLTALSQLQEQDEVELLARLQRDDTDPYANPFLPLPPLARTLAWLILSHHHLPGNRGETGPEPPLEYIDCWLTHQLTSSWNSRFKPQDKENALNWTFPAGTPLRSAVWRQKARKFAMRALQHAPLEQYAHLDQRFTAHMARLCLMLADHYYSAQPPQAGWHDKSYPPHANSDSQSKRLKQRLDEHLTGVAHHAWLLGRHLPHIRKNLPAIVRHRSFKQSSSEERFRWQDKAYETARALAPRATRQGFFGVNMASTGCGKTLANARIMYALADEKQGCRFTVALGLRTLTLQTGSALQARLKLNSGDLAVLTGSPAIQQLYGLAQSGADNSDSEAPAGSAAAEELYAEPHHIRYEGSLNTVRLSQWLTKDDKINKLLNAPVLVTTIDHIIPATEGVRGGKQIAPMLRLLTADLVLDEPDDFDGNDRHALCRLVNWAGMLGCRILLSSATFTPAQVQALFAAYRSGRAYYQQACGAADTPPAICCAWFDEKAPVQTQDIADGKTFSVAHAAFVSRRVQHLQRNTIKRYGELIAVTPADRTIEAVTRAMAQRLHLSLLQLHAEHHQTHRAAGRELSVGLIRMANINPLAAVAQQLFTLGAPENTRIHYCVYHGQHPLAGRSSIESSLDRVLMRHQPEAIWQMPEIAGRLESYTEQKHIFVVLATAVAEVGRDHDYDWAIIEPSSVRSIVQLAGRVRRHRPCAVRPATANIHLLRKNYRALRGKTFACCRPGFEDRHFRLHSHDLQDLLPEEFMARIDAIPSIQQPQLSKGTLFSDLRVLEHARIRAELGGTPGKPAGFCAALWWRSEATWSCELQRRTPFRYSEPDTQYYLRLTEENKLQWAVPDEGDAGWKAIAFQRARYAFAAGCGPWLELRYDRLYQRLAEEMNMTLAEVSQTFGEISLPLRQDEGWYFDPFLGVFGAPG
ncbi:CRISPR-associated nuclease/helicase Cas3 subtype I-F/YPEST [Mixta theicola]|nr:type I-F CRISPR-associated helicase Cas3f [Mixta theicola]QHM76539.1 CRISPR-associated nuclease/helicase Cas3 subtype I-F/YPEST [Mixta theicola]